MKKTLLSLSIAGIAAIIFIASCQKTYNPQGTIVTGATPSLNQLFAGLRTTPQGLSVTAGRDTVVYGAKGTMLHFYTNSFKDANGSIITTGTINLQLTEMYKASDMICNRATTMANGEILQSGGQITIVASMNGQQVTANAYGIGYARANASSARMAMFYGNTANSDSTATWTQSDTTHFGAVANGTRADSVGGGVHGTNFFYFDTCSSFTGANCDWFYTNDSPKVAVSVILPDTSFNLKNTQLYIILPNINRWGNTADTFTAVLSESGYGSGTYTAATNTLQLISEGHTAIVPAGLNYELVVITNKNGQYYYYQQTGIMPHNGLNVNVAIGLAKDTQADIATRLQAL